MGVQILSRIHPKQLFFTINEKPSLTGIWTVDVKFVVNFFHNFESSNKKKFNGNIFCFLAWLNNRKNNQNATGVFHWLCNLNSADSATNLTSPVERQKRHPFKRTQKHVILVASRVTNEGLQPGHKCNGTGSGQDH